MSFLGRFTLWGGIKRIAILITVVLLALITFIYWGINFPDGDWFIGGEDEKKELYEYIKFIKRMDRGIHNIPWIFTIISFFSMSLYI